MKALAIIGLLISTNVAALTLDDNPTKPFDASKNQYVNVKLSWYPVADIQKTCKAEYKKRGLGDLTFKVDACSFWVGNECTVFTRLNPSMHDVGHEVRHCFQFGWH